MKIDWRVSSIVAGSAFLLSVVIGVIGGVSFGILILRAVIAAVVFGAGAIGIGIVVDRFLPELRGGATDDAGEPGGRTVDIVVDDTPFTGDDAVAVEDDGTDLEPASDDESEDVGELEPEGYVDDSGVLEDVEESEHDSGTGGEPSGEDEIEELSSTDGLPRVEALESGFREVPLGNGRVEEVTSSGEDPATMARAIRTVLRREG